MDYYFLDFVSWQHSQLLYHAAAHLGREMVIILRPATPYICLGFHQDAQQEIELEFARRVGIPVFRREVGGGAVYLDGGQLFYQFILNKDHPGLPGNKDDLYRKFLQPIIATYQDFGIPAEFKPVNDIIVANKKISGTGAGEIENQVVLVGNFILDFNYELMAKVLRVPDEKFRDKVYKTLRENLTTMRAENGTVPTCIELAARLAHHLEPLLGSLEWKTEIDPQIQKEADELAVKMCSQDWLYANDQRRPEPAKVKIRAGVEVLQRTVKLPGGLVRMTAVCEEGRLMDVHISGDFFIYPQTAVIDLEKALEGQPLDLDQLAETISAYYQRANIETPGISPRALAEVLVS